MTVGLPIPRRTVGEPPVWVGERRGAPVGDSGSNRRKIPSPMGPLAALLGDSPAMKALRESAARLLQHPSDRGRLPSLLLQGGTGVGKGALARALHEEGPRKDQPFQDLNCAAIPQNLLEAELFGFERGAFTDARQPKAGLFQAANRGTLFLDEIGELPLELQAKLLKVLEDRAVRRLGATRTEPVDVWIIAASNQNLLAEAHARRFRQDLYHRLAVVTLTLPLLRDRGADVILLAEHFLAEYCDEYGMPAKTLAPETRAALLAHPWQGNVRELANTMERVALLVDAAVVMPAMLDLTPVHDGPVPDPIEPPAPSRGLGAAMHAVEREQLLEALAESFWNVTRAARRLGISRDTLRYRIAKHQLRLRPGGRRLPARAGGPERARPKPIAGASRAGRPRCAALGRPLGATPGDAPPSRDRRPPARGRPAVSQPAHRGTDREDPELRRPGRGPRPDRHRGVLRARAARGRDPPGGARSGRDPQSGRAGPPGPAARHHRPRGYPRDPAPGRARGPRDPARARRQAPRLGRPGRAPPARRARPDGRVRAGSAISRSPVRARAPSSTGGRRGLGLPARRRRPRQPGGGPPADHPGRAQSRVGAPAGPSRHRGRRARPGRGHRGRGGDRQVPPAARAQAPPAGRADRVVRGPLPLVRERGPVPARHRHPPAKLPHLRERRPRRRWRAKCARGSRSSAWTRRSGRCTCTTFSG